MQLQCTGRYIHFIVMKMMIKGVQTANCNPILESRQKRQLQRTIDTASKILHFWRKGGGLQKGHLSHVKMLQSASKIHLLNSYNLSSQVICESAVFLSDLELHRIELDGQRRHLQERLFLESFRWVEMGWGRNNDGKAYQCTLTIKRIQESWTISYLTKIWCRKGEGEKGKQLSVEKNWKNISVYIANCISSNYQMYLSRIWCRKREGEEGKQLSVGETGALITEVAPLVSTKEPNFLGQIFDFFSRANCSPDPWLFGEEQRRTLKYLVRRT